MRQKNTVFLDFIKKHIFSGVLCLTFILVLVSFYPYLLNLVKAWNTEEYSHGFLLPVIASFIGWHKLAEKTPDLDKPSYTGIIILILGFLFLLVSQLSAFEPPAHYGFLLCFTGILLSFYGISFVKAVSPALVYLIFCIPLPKLIEVILSAKLQLISSTFGVYMLQTMGYTVFQEGNIIDLGYQKLQVVEACSGLRYLFPLMSLGFLIALLLEDKLWKRAFVFLSTIPITIVMNSLRIAWVGVLVNWKGADMAEGLIHDLQGLTVFFVAFVVFLAETWVLTKFSKNNARIKYEYLGFASGTIGKGRPVLGGSILLAFTICLFFSVVQYSGVTEKRQQYIPEREKFYSFPTQIDDWHAQKEFLDKEILRALHLTDYISYNFTKENVEAPINLYIAYYEKQGIGRSIHSPANCIPGGGWKITQKSTIDIPLENNDLPIVKIKIEKDQSKALVYYWFAQRGRIINSQYGAKFYLFVDSIMKNRTDGALIRLTVPVASTASEQETDTEVQNFIKDIYPLIQKYIPN